MKKITASQLHAIINVKADIIKSLVSQQEAMGRKATKEFVQHASQLSNKLVHPSA